MPEALAEQVGALSRRLRERQDQLRFPENIRENSETALISFDHAGSLKQDVSPAVDLVCHLPEKVHDDFGPHPSILHSRRPH